MSILGDITGGLLGGGSSASVSSTVTVDLKGLDKIGLTETVNLSPINLTETIDLKPIEVKPLSITETVDLKPLNITETVDLKPIEIRPLNISETVDLRPVAVDSCQTVRLAPLPETQVCNPYRHHVAMSLFGLEVMAMTYDGESEQSIHSPRRPQVAERTTFPMRGDARPPRVLGEGGGIRVRVLDDDDDDD
jgi:hypothetical protein